MTLLVSLLVLGVLIFVHELGHFLVAKWQGVGVVEFAIGFGRIIWQRTWGETTYSLRLIPLGGYVRMVGDDPRQLATGEVGSASPLEGDVPVEPALLSDRSRWFLSKGYWPKAAIVFAGPLFNIIFAVVVSILSFAVFGRDVAIDAPVIGGTVPGYPAEQAGLKPRDRVVSIDGKTLTSWSDLAGTVGASGGRELSFRVSRPGQKGAPDEELDLKVTGTRDTSELAILDDAPPVVDSWKIGIVPEAKREPVTLGEAFTGGFVHVWYLSKVTVKGLWGMVQGVISLKNLGGPIFIFKEAARSAESGVPELLAFMVFLSVSLAILNLLPIPILDGGHLVFFTIEALKGSPVSLRVHEFANQVGMCILFLMMFLALGNDILRLL